MKRSRPSQETGFFRAVNNRSHAKANRRLHSRGKAVWASIAIEDIEEDEDSHGFARDVVRFLLGLFLLPLCWVTTWTFLTRFFHATVEQGFWQSSQFWYFAIGAVVMLGWFFSKLIRPFFLYIYVFGHELTHAAFVKIFGGRVLDMDWGSEGGYVTTDKSNWVIALSPYFIPFWSTIAVVVYVVFSVFSEVTPLWNLFFYAVIGATWTFHLTWTIWMIPRDQPDLKDNGTFLSLVLIWFGNLLVLTALLCLASPSPVESFRNFGFSWFGTALTWGDFAMRWLEGFAENMMSKF